MITQNKIDKLEAELNDLQARTSTRNLTVSECVKAIEAAEEAIAEHVRPELRGQVRFQFNPHRVAKSYGYTAEGTVMRCTFTKAGKVRGIKVSRDYVTSYETVRLVVDVTDWIEGEFGLTRQEFGADKFNKLELIVLSASGFNYHGTMPIDY
jgi:hypothetical protein